MPRLGAVAVPVIVWCLARAVPAPGQTTSSAQAGLGTVRFAGGSTASVLSFSPDFAAVGENLQFSLGGIVASVPRGSGYGQLRSAAWVSTQPIAGSWRVASDLELSGTAVGGGHASGAGSITGEALYVTRRWGAAFGAGPASGWITASPPVTALHTRARGWWSDAGGRTALTASVEPTRFLGRWFTDVSGTIVRRRGGFTAQLTAAGRISSSYVSRAAAVASVELRVTPSWSFTLVGGNVLPDPYQNFPATAVLLIGARYHLPLHATSHLLIRGSALQVTRSVDGVILRFEHSAGSVSVSGDWNNWVPAPLTATRRDRWEATLPLAPGVYHFTLLVDGVSWAIPSGVPSVLDGFGGRVAVLVVTP